MKILLVRSSLLPRALRHLEPSCRAFGSTVISLSRGPQEVNDSEIEAADPFLSKLQQQTEASYMELISRKEEVPRTEDEAKAEEEKEVTSPQTRLFTASNNAVVPRAIR